MDVSKAFQCLCDKLENGYTVSALEQAQSFSKGASLYLKSLHTNDLDTSEFIKASNEVFNLSCGYYAFAQESPILGYFALSHCISRSYWLYSAIRTIQAAMWAKQSNGVLTPLDANKIILSVRVKRYDFNKVMSYYRLARKDLSNNPERCRKRLCAALDELGCSIDYDYMPEGVKVPCKEAFHVLYHESLGVQLDIIGSVLGILGIEGI